jgi:CRISPR-associated endonuclease Cas1
MLHLSSDLEIISLLLNFRILRPITNLPWYQGTRWNGYFRYVFRYHIPRYIHKSDGRMDFVNAGIRVIPIETGIPAYKQGDTAAVRLVVDVWKSSMQEIDTALCMLSDSGRSRLMFPKEETVRQYSFHPDSVELVSVVCEQCGDIWNSLHSCRITNERIDDEVKSLSGQPLTMILTTPLIAGKPGFSNGQVDAGYMLSRQGRDNFWKVFSQQKDADSEFNPLPVVEDSLLIWIKTSPGAEWRSYAKRNYSGVIGCILWEPIESDDFLKQLIIYQYIGLGKNTSFGFGTYYIAESDFRLKGRRQTTLVGSQVTPSMLMKAAKKLPYFPKKETDILSGDLQQAPLSWFAFFIETVKDDYPFQRTICSYSLKSKSGIRKLMISDPVDHLFQKLLSLEMESAYDSEHSSLFSSSCMAYRKRHSYLQAVNIASQYYQKHTGSVGIVTDINGFFDSLDRKKLLNLLTALASGDPVLRQIEQWFGFLKEHQISGVPQGSPLSPLLSNLFLTVLDQRMDLILHAREALYIRYADDILLLAPDEKVLKTAEVELYSILKSLNLTQNSDKLQKFSGSSFTFLGFTIYPDKPALKNSNDTVSTWQSLSFRPYCEGFPLYLTSDVKGISADTDAVTISYYYDASRKTEKFYWKEVNKIYIIGLSSYSTKLLHFAMKKNISVSLLDYSGYLKGMFQSTNDMDSKLPLRQAKLFDQYEYRLSCAKNLIKSKLHSSLFFLEEVKESCQEKAAEAINRIHSTIELLDKVESLDELRGREGAAAAQVFSVFPELVKPFSFEGRSYRPPKDEVNALLSFGYTLLYTRAAVTIKNYGLLPHVGLFHLPHGRHMVLASDLIEPFRFMIDLLVTELIQKESIKPEHFFLSKKNFPYLNWEEKKLFIRQFERMFLIRDFPVKDSRPHPVSWCLDVTVKRLAASIRLNSEFIPASL